MRAASGLLVAVLLTTCVISGTFAKYVTDKTGTDTARVAKFGVAIQSEGTTFAKEYNGTDNAKTVLSSTTDDKVVAPGTAGNMANIIVTGTPEVKVKVSYKGEFALDDNWTVGENKTFYCPLEVTVKSTNGETVIKGTEQTSKDTFVNEVNKAIAAYSQTYAPNTNLGEKGSENLTVSWKWAFEGSGDTAGDTDKKDTALGDASANNTTNAGHVTLKVTTTVTQID